MGLLGLVQVVEVPATGVLAVVELVEGLTQHCDHTVAGWVEPVQLGFGCV